MASNWISKVFDNFPDYICIDFEESDSGSVIYTNAFTNAIPCSELTSSYRTFLGLVDSASYKRQSYGKRSGNVYYWYCSGSAGAQLSELNVRYYWVAMFWP